MKRSSWIFTLSVCSVAVGIFFAGCSDKGNVNAPQQVNLESAQFAVIDYGDVQNAVEDATLDTPMTFNATMLSYNFMNGDRSFAPGDPLFLGMQWFDRFDFHKHLGLFFMQLNLTSDQKTQIRDLFKTFQTDMKPLVQQFYDANKDIISASNATRKTILDSLKAGTITRDQASADLKTLNQATHSQIDANPASQSVKASMCTERDKLFAGISAVLQGDQLTKWNQWISTIKNPCSS